MLTRIAEQFPVFLLTSGFFMNSITSLLPAAFIAAITGCHPVAAFANTALEISLPKILHSVQIYSPFSEERSILENWAEDPDPTRASRAGGSR